MNKHKVAGLLGDMARVCKELQTEILGHPDALDRDTREPARIRVGAGGKKKGPTNWIKDLVAVGFFATPRTDLEVKQELKRRAHGCRRVTVAVALSRLVGQNALTRIGDGTKKSAYRYSVPE
jgi:hypothetical protein